MALVDHVDVLRAITSKGLDIILIPSRQSIENMARELNALGGIYNVVKKFWVQPTVFFLSWDLTSVGGEHVKEIHYYNW